MTQEWPRLLISCSQGKKNQRQKSDKWQCSCEYCSRSATVSVAVLRMGYAEVVFILPGGKLDTMWRGAWQRLATRHQGEMCPLQIVTAAGRCSLSHSQKHRTCSVRTFSLLSQIFCYRIARIWTRLTCHVGCSSADGLPLSKFLLRWQNEESDCQKHGRNYRMAQSLPIRQLFIYGKCYLPDGATIFQGWFK